jgi:UDP-N-acetylmuramate--alanine ligase
VKTLDGVTRVHLLGIGGIGVSAVARLLLERGYEVTGSDVRESQLTEMMRGLGAKVTIGHRTQNVDGAQLVIVSGAIPEDNLELVAARAAEVPVMHRADILGALLEGRDSVGVTGTHGKGTVSSMITWILDRADMEPGFVIGGLLNNYGVNARDGKGPLVAEVDESDGSNHRVHPQRVVCNFLELDHLNYYSGIEDIIGSMAEYVRGNPNLEHLFVNADCEGNRRLMDMVDTKTTTYGIDRDDVDFRGELLGRGQMPIPYRVWRGEELLGEGTLDLPGRYNVVNACGAIAVAVDLGVPPKVAIEALATYRGLENRFTINEAGGVYLVKDYNSHPTCMRKVLESARDLVTGRLISVFKPYRYTLMNYLGDEYAACFQGSDKVVITTMYAAREKPIPGVNTDTFVANLRSEGFQVVHLPEQTDIHPWVVENAQPGDGIVFFGGDDFFRMADAIGDEIRG